MWKTCGFVVVLLAMLPFASPSFAQDPPPGMVLIPAGGYEMGDHHDNMPKALPVHTVNIDAFYMDIYEVTNEQYAAALNWAWDQGGLIVVIYDMVLNADNLENPYCQTGPDELESGITWNGSTFSSVPGRESHPMTRVSWYGAAAYSNWRNAMEGHPPSYNTSTWACNFVTGRYRLPTEAEWEKAARGGEYDPYYRYPWGNTMISTIANYLDSGDPYGPGPSPDTTPVGFYNGELHYKVDFGWPASMTSYQTSDGENGFGLYDMSGNVAEWCNDWHSATYYSSSPSSNPRGPVSSPTTERVMRDSHWNFNEYYPVCAYRNDPYPPWHQVGNCFGFRLVLGTTGTFTTLSTDLNCTPPSGTLPFSLRIDVIFDNLVDNYRTFAGRVDVTLASGTLFTNFRAGYTNLLPFEHSERWWDQNLPSFGTLVGENTFVLSTMDVTPAPYNQPPFWPSGDTDTASCTVTGIAP